jgi:chorismate mutase
MPAAGPTPELIAARAELDAIDAEVHALILKRAGAIARIEAAKKVAPGRSSYRPAREADMMRRLAARHRGPFPLASAEHIFREIITAFIRLQSPFAVQLGTRSIETRDLARFQFGASTPLIAHDDPAAAIAALETRAADLALVPAGDDGAGPWWEALGHGAEPALIVARVPFLLGTVSLPPAYVVGRVAVEPTGDDRTLLAIIGGADEAPEALAARVPNAKPVAARLVGARHHVLATVPGFLGADDPLPEGVRRVGAYAAPVTTE